MTVGGMGFIPERLLMMMMMIILTKCSSPKGVKICVASHYVRIYTSIPVLLG